MGMKEAEAEVFHKQKLNTTQTLIEKVGKNSFLSVLNEILCRNNDIGDPLSNDIFEILRIHYTLLKKFL